MRIRRKLLMGALVTGLVVSVVGAAVAAVDFGVFRDAQLANKAPQLYGVKAPLASSSHTSVSAATANADPTKLVTLAPGLTAKVITAGVAAQNLDMIALWPSPSDPQWIIECNEQGTAEPGLQRINIATHSVETIVTGTTSCDPVRETAWGTIVFGEEAGSGATGGRLYELMNPLDTTGVTLDRATGVFSGGTGAENLTALPAVGRLSFEGLALFPNGLLYFGDENRPLNGAAGGAFFKFVPTTPYDPSTGPISNLSGSPLAAGTIYGLRLGKRSSNTDYGQGTNDGLGTWITIGSGADLDLRSLGAAAGLSGFYRPEDAEADPVALAAGKVRWCGTNTGNESQDRLYGDMVCVTDGTLAQATANTSTPELEEFVVGNPELAMMDNIAFQPGRANWILHEDGDGASFTPQRNNDLWDCLPDGADVDLTSDGCIRVATINDLVGTEGQAEWTGGIFDATGTRFFVSVQHNITGFGTILEIDGWK
jgi:secreted PhoX family phosphatase